MALAFELVNFAFTDLSATDLALFLESRNAQSTVRDKFCRDNRRMFRPRVSQRADDCGLFKAGSTEFIEECTCIPCASDSREPIGAARLEMRRQR